VVLAPVGTPRGEHLVGECVDAEERRRELAGENETADGFFKIADDPRITGLG
jgi:hypothetical protein